MRFYIGLHHVSLAAHFERSCISIRTLAKRRKLVHGRILVDSGAFSEISLHGRYVTSVADYAAQLRRLHDNGIVNIDAAVSQDYMCEPFMLAKTGLTVADHQRLTIERYDALLAEMPPVPIMPVLQGYDPADYRAHVRAYGDRLKPGMWVGVGSVCKRNGRPDRIIDVLSAIKGERPDLRLHGFGIKRTALANSGVVEMLYSADSMAWSFAARYEGRDRNGVVSAKSFNDEVVSIAARPSQPWQTVLLL